MIKVCHVIFQHRIFDGRIFYKEAISLGKHGYRVVLLAPTLDGVTAGIRKKIPMSSLTKYEGSGIHFQYYRYHKKIPKLFGLRHGLNMRRLVDKLIEIDAELYHFHEYRFTMEAALKLKKRNPGVKLVFDFHEFYHHQMRTKKKWKKHSKNYVKLENKLLDNVDHIFTVSDFITDYYRTLVGCRVTTIMNCQSENIFQTPPLINHEQMDGSFWIVHEGVMTFERGLKFIIEVAKHITVPNIKFLFIGNLFAREKAYLKNKIKEYYLGDKFHITGFLDYLEVPSWMVRCKMGLFLNGSINAKAGMGNKVFNYLRFGLPIDGLEHPVLSEWIHRYQIGMSISTRDPQRTAHAIEALYKDPARYAQMAKNARELFQETLNWDVMETRLLHAYQSILEIE